LRTSLGDGSELIAAGSRHSARVPTQRLIS
jgi:hypothetical protein